MGHQAIGWLLFACLSPCEAEEPSVVWRTTATMPAEEAHQAVAADEHSVYVIASRVIARYDRATGERLATSTGEATHLNSGYFWQGRLYCAHSNYPALPERSELMVLDPRSMELSTFHHFAHQPGSLTWAVRHQEAWWCNFAFYDADQGKSYLARFDDEWREQGRWSYPANLIEQLGRYSLSGGLFYDGHLLATDHDHSVVYQLQVPEQPGELTLLAAQPAPFAGQGIAHDPVTGGLVGIVRRQRLVVFAQRERVPVDTASRKSP